MIISTMATVKLVGKESKMGGRMIISVMEDKRMDVEKLKGKDIWVVIDDEIS